MLPKLTPQQARVIGVLIEKEITTPDQYPLTLNGLTTGCNQKSNREPVMDLSESEVQTVIDELMAKNLLFEISGNRAMKYKHRFCNTEFNSLKFDAQQTAILCVMLLRGAQTPGELRTRTNRLAEFNNVQDVEHALNALGDYNGDQLVVKLERELGKRESRYQHLFTDQDDSFTSPTSSSELHESAASNSHNQAESADMRIAKLESEVALLKQQVNTLLAELGL